MNQAFDDSCLLTGDLPAAAEEVIRGLASTGARVRTAARGLGDHRLPDQGRPRGILVLGAEARLIRSVLEPVCPVPLVAWPFGHLPAWVGPLDLVVAIDGDPTASWWDSPGAPADPSASVAEAVRRGASVVVACPHSSACRQYLDGRDHVHVETGGTDPLASAVAVLAVLDRMGLGPRVDPEQVARAADMVAEECSPHRGVTDNPAKDLACALAEADPLLWGGSVLAARASRRVAEALRRASGRSALAADARALSPVIEAATPRDPFRDPTLEAAPRRPVLVVLDDADPAGERDRRHLEELTAAHDVTVCRVGLPLGAEESGALDRYVSLLLRGRFAAAYLALGLGRLDGQDRA